LDNFIDLYLDDNKVLKNLVNAKTDAELLEAEALFVYSRTIELAEMNTAFNINKFDLLKELQNIHRHLFQDIFDWAGKIRVVDIKKNIPDSDFFLPVSMIEKASCFVTKELIDEKLLRHLKMKDFVNRLAYFYDQVNYIHPFREGNGRTQRILFDIIARQAKYKINWLKTTGQKNDEASKVAAKSRNLSLLIEMFSEIVTACKGRRVAPER
jgi:cell filamentation protein